MNVEKYEWRDRLLGIETAIDSIFLLFMWHFGYRIGFWIFLVLVLINSFVVAELAK